MFGWFFGKKKNKNDFVDKNGNVTESAISYDKANDRYLRLKDTDCGIVLHGDGNVEVIFTKSYNDEVQSITDNEETLMALAVFMKQPGFLEMIVDEFRKIASQKMKSLSSNIKDE